MAGVLGALPYRTERGPPHWFMDYRASGPVEARDAQPEIGGGLLRLGRINWSAAVLEVSMRSLTTSIDPG